MPRKKKLTYRQAVLAVDPGAHVVGPFRFGHYVNYEVKGSDGKTLGWTEGNEYGHALAWVRAYTTLQQQGKI